MLSRKVLIACIVVVVVLALVPLTGSDDGFVGVPLPEAIVGPGAYLYFTLAVVAGSTVALWLICHSGFGLALVAVRENRVRAGFIGLNPRNMRWTAFVVAGVFAGIAGSLFAMYNRGCYIESA